MTFTSSPYPTLPSNQKHLLSARRKSVSIEGYRDAEPTKATARRQSLNLTTPSISMLIKIHFHNCIVRVGHALQANPLRGT